MAATPISAAQIQRNVSAGRPALDTTMYSDEDNDERRRPRASTSTSAPRVKSSQTPDISMRRATGRIHADRSRSSTPLVVNRLYSAPPDPSSLFTVDGHDISIHASDAHPSTWPAITTPQTSDDIWHQAANASTKAYNTWKRKLGESLAVQLGLTRDVTTAGQEPWQLVDWPKGYRMFIQHNKQDGSTGSAYMAGSTFLGDRVFKTSKEFSKHLAWLCQLRDKPNMRCACKHCSSRFERDGLDRSYITRIISPQPATRNSSQLQVPSTPVKPTASPPILVPPQPANATPVTMQDILADVMTAGAESRARAKGKAREQSLSNLIISAEPTATPAQAEESLFSKAMANPTGRSTTIAGGAIRARGASMMSDASNKGFYPPHSAKSDTAKRLPSARKTPHKVLGKRKLDEVEDEYVNEENGAEEGEFEVSIDLHLNVKEEGPARGRPRRKAAPTNLDWKKLIEEKDPQEGEIKRERKRADKESIKEYMGQYVKKDRIEELSDLKYLFREDELVWYLLPKPLADPQDDNLVITHWPAIVDHRIFSTRHLRPPKLPAPGQAPELHIEKYKRFVVNLLGLDGESNEILCERTSLAPWLLDPTQPRLFDDERIGMLKPFKDRPALPDMDTFDKALSAWTFAVLQGKRIAETFSLAARYHTEKKCIMPSKEDLSEQVYRRRKAAVRAARAKAPMLYQCLWLGAERIWAGEIVRMAGQWNVNDDGKAILQVIFSDGDRAEMGKNAARVITFDKMRVSIDSRGKPAFLRVHRIERNRETAEAQVTGELIELVETKGKAIVAPPAIDVGKADPDAMPLSSYYEHKFTPAGPAGKVFRRLQQEDGKSDASFVVPMMLVAGRIYPRGTCWSSNEGELLKKNSAALTGKRYRTDMVAKPVEWKLNRTTILAEAEEDAEDDMIELLVRQNRYRLPTPVPQAEEADEASREDSGEEDASDESDATEDMDEAELAGHSRKNGPRRRMAELLQ